MHQCCKASLFILILTIVIPNQSNQTTNSPGPTGPPNNPSQTTVSGPTTPGLLRRIAQYLKIAYEENRLGVKSSARQMKEEVLKSMFLHIKEVITKTCEFLKSNPIYSKYAQPMCEAIQKIANEAGITSGTGPNAGPGAGPGANSGGGPNPGPSAGPGMQGGPKPGGPVVPTPQVPSPGW